MNIRRAILGTMLIIAFIWLMQPANLSVLVLFIFLGIVPGTDIVVPAWIMLPACAIIGLLAILWLIRQPAKVTLPTKKAPTARTARTRKRTSPSRKVSHRYAETANLHR